MQDEMKTVFVHGVDGTAAGAEELAARLFGNELRVVTYDLIGRGKDAGNKSTDHSLQAYVRQLREVVSKATRGAKEKRVNLIGYSMGGAVSAAYAAEHPDKVSKLVLVCPAGRISMSGYHSTALPFPLWSATVPPVLFGNIKESYGSGRDLKGIVERTRELYSDAGFKRVLYETLRQFPLHDLQLPPSSRPVLVIAADGDRVVSERAVRDLHGSLGDRARLAVYKGTHALPYRKPKTVGRAILRYLREKKGIS